MAATFALTGVPHPFPDGSSLITGTITMDSSYPTGGESLASLFATYLSSVVHLQAGLNGGYVPEWDSANGKLLVFEAGADGAALDEVADTTDLSAVVFPVMVMGKTE